MSGRCREPEHHCVTCADEAISMRVLEVRGDVALCLDACGTPHEVTVELIEPPVRPDQRVLVHAGVAIA